MQVFLKISTKKDIKQNKKVPDLNLANLFTIHHVTRDDFKLGWTYRNFLDKFGNPFTKPPWH